MTGRDVRGMRERLEMTQAEFAALLHTSQASVCQWETGVSRVSRPIAELIRIKYEQALKSLPSAVA